MRRSWPRLAQLAVLGGLVGIIIVGLMTGGESSGDRVESLAERLRCPVCQSESVADSSSQTARDMRSLIGERIEAGDSDSEVEAFFVARYGEWILLDPPASGRTLLVWLLPIFAAAAGLILVLTRRRRASPQAFADPSALEDQLSSARADLAEVAAQAQVGDIDGLTAKRLDDTYRAEIETLESQLIAEQDDEPATLPSRARVLWGVGIIAVGVAAVTVAAIAAVEPRSDGGFVTGGIEEQNPLDDVSNEELEQVVAANPELIPMRLALARRYFEAGEYSEALEHYLPILETEQNPEALANVGWMAYASGEAGTAAGYLEQSLEVAPDYPQAKWFLANVRYFGLDDRPSARALLEDVLATDSVPSDIRQEAARMLGEVDG